MPEISIQEISAALKQMKNHKCPENKLTSIMFKFGGNVLLGSSKDLFNKCLEGNSTPRDCQNAECTYL